MLERSSTCSPSQLCFILPGKFRLFLLCQPELTKAVPIQTVWSIVRYRVLADLPGSRSRLRCKFHSSFSPSVSKVSLESIKHRIQGGFSVAVKASTATNSGYTLFVQLASGIAFLPAASSVSHWFKYRRATALGVLATGSSIGGVVYPIMLNRLFTQIGFAWTVRAGKFSLTSRLASGSG